MCGLSFEMRFYHETVKPRNVRACGPKQKLENSLWLGFRSYFQGTRRLQVHRTLTNQLKMVSKTPRATSRLDGQNAFFWDGSAFGELKRGTVGQCSKELLRWPRIPFATSGLPFRNPYSWHVHKTENVSHPAMASQKSLHLWGSSVSRSED